MLLYGDNRFVRHWLFYQTKIEMCSEKNPAGDVLSRAPYLGVLVASMFVGVVVTIKRYWMAHHLARRLHCKLLLVDCVTVSLLSLSPHTEHPS